MKISYEKNRITVQVNLNLSERNEFYSCFLVKLKISIVKIIINDKNLKNSEIIRRMLY